MEPMVSIKESDLKTLVFGFHKAMSVAHDVQLLDFNNPQHLVKLGAHMQDAINNRENVQDVINSIIRETQVDWD